MNIIAVAVLYRCRPDRSPAIASLARSYRQCAVSGLSLKLVIYDNSPEPQPVNVPLPFDHQYVHDPCNGGLAAAYNYALGSDPGGHYQWLLLLDQDSGLPENFIALTREAMQAADLPGEVAAVVPRVTHDGKPLSPARLQWWGGVRPITNPVPGICAEPVTAVNSGSLLRKSFLSEIGGFNPSFKLDYLDHWLFAEINRRGKKTYLSPALIEHDLSVWNSGSVPPERYRSILEAETLFYRTSLEPASFKYHLMNLALRACRQWLSGKQRLGRLTAGHLRQISANR